MSVSQSILSAVFSDESPAYRFPSEPDPGDTVAIRIRVAKDSASRVILLMESLTVGMLMVKAKSDEFFDYFEAGLFCNETEVSYRFLIECPDGTRIAYDKSGVRADEHNVPDSTRPTPSVSFPASMSLPGPRVP